MPDRFIFSIVHRSASNYELGIRIFRGSALERDRLVAVLPLITWRNRLVGAPALHVVLYSGSGT